MTRRLLVAARRPFTRITLAFIVTGSSLFSSSLAHASPPPDVLPAGDPDAAQGLDDPGWAPKPGSVRVATLPSGLGSLPVGIAGGLSAQAADDFNWEGRTTNLFVYCVRPSKRDAEYADVKACFKARRFDDERDSHGRAYIGEGFKVFASGKDGWRLDRVKGRAEQPAGRAVDWAPTADEEHGNPATINVSAGWNGSGLSTSWNLYPGRMHPWVGDTIFHSSWMNQATGAPSGRAVSSVGAAVWQFEGHEAVRQDTGRAEVWLIK